MFSTFARNVLAPAALLALAGVASAQDSLNAFTIQGFLQSEGQPVDRAVQVQVEFYTTPGGATGRIGQPIFFSPVMVEDGLFNLEIWPNFVLTAAEFQQIADLPDVFVQFAFRELGDANFTPMATRIPFRDVTRATRADFASDVPTSLKPFVISGTEIATRAGLNALGINIANPDHTLHVNGDARIHNRVLLGLNNSSQWTIENQTSAGALLFTGPGGDVLRLDVDGTNFKGNVRISGELEIDRAITINGADIAEPFDVSGPIQPLPGHVVVIDPANPGDLMLAERPYDRRVAGVISGANGINPAMHLRQPGTIADGEHPVAMTGRVFVYADASAGPIQPGDLLTTSSIPGHAMKASDRDAMHGAIIGKAITALDQGQGMVLVLVNLQ